MAQVTVDIFMPDVPDDESFQYECSDFDLPDVIRGLLLTDQYKGFTHISICPAEDKEIPRTG